MSSESAISLHGLREAIRERGIADGFSRVGFAPAEPLDEATLRRWERWLSRDVAGEMTYLKRPKPRRTHPRDLLPEAQSVIVVSAGYFQGDHPDLTPEEARIARYAWGRDYHKVLRDKLGELARWIEGEAAQSGYPNPVTWRAVTDSAPLDERSLAVRAGLGFFGKNTLVLDPEGGSWTLLAELLISIPLAPDDPLQPGQCESCRKCLDVCPTGALTGPYEMDPRLCISYLTIEQRGPIPESLQERMDGWAFGCDLCQEVCPFNASPLRGEIEDFRPELGSGPVASEKLWQDIHSKKGFLRRWGDTPLERPGLEGMKRNLKAALKSRRKS